jgi:hypothetical protein
MSAIEPTPIQFRWYLSVAVVLFVFVIVGIYSSRMAHNADHTDGYDQQQAQERLAKLHKMQDTDQKTLTTADWIDQGKGIVRIPIDEAMTEEVAVLKAKPVAIGTAIPGVAPAAAPAPAPAAPASATTASTNAPTAANPHPTK